MSEEISWVEKARKGEVTLPEAMTWEEDEWLREHHNVNLPFIRRWAKEPDAVWEKKKAEIISKEMTPEQHRIACEKMMKALSDGTVE